MSLDAPKPLFGTWKSLGSGPTRGSKAWQSYFGIFVISAVETTARGPERHISISVLGKMPAKEDILWAQRCFGAELWERDDHSKSHASFWQPVNQDLRGPCECKT